MEYFHRNKTVWFATPISNIKRVLFKSNADDLTDQSHLPAILAIDAYGMPEGWWPPVNLVGGGPLYNPESSVDKERNLVLIMVPNNTWVRLYIRPERVRREEWPPVAFHLHVC